jgi:hypothetical protein
MDEVEEEFSVDDLQREAAEVKRLTEDFAEQKIHHSTLHSEKFLAKLSAADVDR